MTVEAIEPMAAIRPSAITSPSPPPPPDGAATGMAVAETALAELAAPGLTAVAPTAGRAAGTPLDAGLTATELEAGTREVSFLGGAEGIAGRGPAVGGAAPPGPGRGGRLMRTVSFLGALAGAPTGLIAPGGGAEGAGPGIFGPEGGLTTAPGCGTELGGTDEPIGCVGGKLDISAIRSG